MLLLGSPWQPCSIAFARASRRAISTSNSLPAASFMSRTTRMTPSQTEEAAAASAGITMLSRQDEHRGMSPLSSSTWSSASRSSPTRRSCRASARSRASSACAQLQQVPAQLELRLDLSLEGLQGRLLPRGQRPRHPVDDAQGSEGVPVGGDEGRARVEPDVRGQRPRAGCRGSVRRPGRRGRRRDRAAGWRGRRRRCSARSPGRRRPPAP